MIRFKVILMYAGFAAAFAACFAVMFIMLTAAVMGIPSGLMLAVLGFAILIFKADFVITELAPELMLFGGLSGAFAAAFLGAAAVKLGYIVSRLFLKVRRRGERLLQSPRIEDAIQEELTEEEIIQEELADGKSC